MTLMPVSNISVLLSRSANAGESRWIGQRWVISSFSPGLRFMHSPTTFHTWFLVTSPTGTVIGEPVSVTSEPRTRPSVGCIEIVLTVLSPRDWATSRVSVLLLPPRSTSTWRALKISGSSVRGNSTSTMGPITRATRPTPAAASSRAVFSTLVAVISRHFLLRRGRWTHQRSH